MMQLNDRLYDAVADKAREVTVDHLCMGLGYTAVMTSDNGMGLAYTYFDVNAGCTLVDGYQDFEGRPATDLLALMKSETYLERSMALALVNALSSAEIGHLPPDTDNRGLFDALAIGPAVKVAMVGYIKPIVRLLESMHAKVEIIDNFRGMGDQEDFFNKLSHWADAALITSTAILNNSLEEILDHLGDHVRAALLGPSTPMAADVFSKWPNVRALAGIAPMEKDAVLKAVRHGLGTPYLHRHCKKITLLLAKRARTSAAAAGQRSA
jgi:uncharacterized protein (DUF4213/DUF364 family)